MIVMMLVLCLQKSRAGTADPAEPTPQDRLEKVWQSLQMPDGLKLDMAIKYSSDEYMSRLEEVGVYVGLYLPK